MAVRMAEPTVRTDWSGPVVPCPGNAFVVRVRLVDGRVDEAWSTGRMVRNMNVLLRGELDDRGRPKFVSQPHCLCNDGHALAAIRAVEDLADVVLPRSAILVRKLVQSLRCMQEHLLHFYQFHLSDWVNREAALRADPVKATRLSSLPGADADLFRTARDWLHSMATTASDASPGHVAQAPHAGPDELHLMLQGHALQAVRVGSSLQTALELLGCNSKGFQAYRPGGLPDDMDLSPALLTALHAELENCREFVETVFPSDLVRLAKVHAPCTEQGRSRALLTWDDANHGSLLLPDANATAWHRSTPVPEAVTEEAEPNWNDRDRHCYRLLRRRAEPSFHWSQARYFWLTAPRHGKTACEVGPLARVMSSFAEADPTMGQFLKRMLDDCGLSLSAMNSTMGRVLSRGIESSCLMRSIQGLLDELEPVLASGQGRSTKFTLPKSGIGTGRVEVPRGTLAHRIRWADGRIVSHEYLIPSLWNFSPRDSAGERGPLEHALLGCAVANPNHPLEILRTLHQLDPCNACHVVIEDRDTGRTTLTTA